jgi:probable FeS assembly SUF system protein SufT
VAKRLPMSERKNVTLAREVQAVEIPAGTKTNLAEGAVVTIFQQLGGNFSVADTYGRMFRVDGCDHDALGVDKPEEVKAAEDRAAGPVDEAAVWDVLRTIFDPEIPVNMVDLGLVYGLLLEEREEGGTRVKVDMTLTAPGCGMADVLQQDVRDKLRALPGVSEVEVELVWDPPWDRERMSEVAKLELGMF